MAKINLRRLMVAVASVLVLASCGTKCENSDLVQERTVVYTVDAKEGRASLHSNNEWDDMLDRFCDYAQSGSAVMFYSMETTSSTVSTKGVGDEPRKPVTISTTNREELKAWMKKMEGEGRTVTITYDEPTGVWNGTAATSAPRLQPQADCYTGHLAMVQGPSGREEHFAGLVWALFVDEDSVYLLSQGGNLLWADGSDISFLTFGDEDDLENDLVQLCGEVSLMSDPDGTVYRVLDITANIKKSVEGEWNFTCYSETTFNMQPGQGGLMSNTTFFDVECGAQPVYNFGDDGMMTISDANGTQTYSWSISEYGEVCCDGFMFDGGCWDISWLTANTLILTRTDFGAQEERIVSMEFHAVR